MPLSRRRWSPWCSAAVLAVLLLLPDSGRAAPGASSRLGGPEPQGPATRALTALHHNPAMLGAFAGSGAQASFSTGVDQLWIRRHAIAADTGAAIGGYMGRDTLVNPLVHYFAGASFYFDPVAVGIGLYDLDTQYRFHSTERLRHHLAPDPPGSGGEACLSVGLGVCPPDGGHVEYRHDLTLAAAWNAGALQLGLAAHFPLVWTRFAYDEDAALGTREETVLTCAAKEDPACAERVGFKGWTRWLALGESTPGFDFAFTFGAAWRFASDRVTLGARYRTFPLRRAGRVILSGVGLVCRPFPTPGEAPVDTSNIVDRCERADVVDAKLAERLPQEVALGGSFVLGPAKLWRIDSNLYWTDTCPGGTAPGRCPDGGQQTLVLEGLDRDSFVLPEFNRYRGLQDIYGVDLWASYRIRSNVTISVGSHLASPGVRPDSMTAANSNGWRLGATVGTAWRIRHGNFLLVPGYGIDTHLPNHVGPGEAAFVPVARTEFEMSKADLNSEAAGAVLAGRARSTNAGRYFGMAHVFTLAFRWAERNERGE